MFNLVKNENGESKIITVLFLIVISIITVSYLMFGNNNNGAVNATKNVTDNIIEQANEVNSTMIIEEY